MSEKSNVRQSKVGTHGKVSGDDGRVMYSSADTDTSEKKELTLREKDKQEWKLRKDRRQERKDIARQAAKRAGVKVGRWQGGVAYAKDGSKRCATFGSPEVRDGYTVIKTAAA